MDVDKIIEKLRENRNDKIRESQICTRGTYSTRDMQMLADGYSMAVKDLSDLIAQQTPPCTGSSVQKQSKVDKLQQSIVKEPIPATVISFDKSGNITFEFKSVDTHKKTPPTNEQLMDKINEIIDVINGER